MPKRKRCMLPAIESWDARNGTSYVRELEMAVDKVVTFDPPYCAQFFVDCRLYGIDEATVYLHKFIDKKYQSPNDLAHDMNAVNDKVNEIYDIIM